jgi:hypothetical protein
VRTEPSYPKPSKEYAAFTNVGFQLQEVIALSQMVLAGRSAEQIRIQVLEDDLLQLPSIQSRRTIAREVLSRLNGVPTVLLEFLTDGSYDLRRLTNLYLLLLKHRLLREFAGEVLVEQLRSLDPQLTTKEVNVFVELKRSQIPAIRSWSDSTVKKAQSNLLRMYEAAGLLVSSGGATSIQIQIVPRSLRAEIEAAGHGSYLRLMLDEASI